MQWKSQDQIEELQRPTVKMKDSNIIEEKICLLIKGGQAKLQVISDFDMTLSRSHLNGNPCTSCHCAVETNHRLPASYRQKAKGFVEKYHPIEIDANLSIEEKLPLMVEWWTNAHKALCETKLKKKDIPDIVKESRVILRDGCQTFLEMLHEHGVLMIIFSGGLGNVIEEVIRQQACLYDTIHIISNYMTFNEDGEVSGFCNDLVHLCNKNSTALRKLSCYNECKERTCILLLGDSIGDVSMDYGLANVEVSLKIGFLNDSVESRLQKYLDNFDIVLIDDQTLDVPNAILRKIL